MSAKDDVFAEHELRDKIVELLMHHQRDVEELVKAWHVDGWSRRVEMRRLRRSYADDIIKEITDGRRCI